MIAEQFTFISEVIVELHDEFGNLKDREVTHNLMTTAGRGFITGRMIGTADAVMSHIGVGSSSTAATIAQTDLVAVIGARVAMSSAVQETGSATNDTVKYVAIFPAGICTGALTEAGIFNALSGGKMLSRVVFGTKTKDAGDSLTITWRQKIL